MKKALILVLALLCLFGLVGCDPGRKTIDGDALLENTVKIELFHYENALPKSFDLNGKNTPVFDFSKATSIATLDEAYFEDIIQDIAEQDYLVFMSALNEPIGKTLVLYQQNGNMVVLFSYIDKGFITKYYGECNIFDENGVFIEHIGRVGSDYVDALETKYFDTPDNAAAG